MTSQENPPTGLIWATRGRFWGFRFLLDGGLADPLPEYERLFRDLGDEPMTWRRAAGRVAVRFPDPLGRRDAAGRVIPHEFVVLGDLADEILSVDDGLQRVWPLVAEAFGRVWDAVGPPAGADLGVTTPSTPLLHSPELADGQSGDGVAECADAP